MRLTAQSSRTWALLALLSITAGTAAIVRQGRAPREATRQASDDAVLRSLPYLTWVSSEENRDKKGVTIHDTARAYRGFNLYSPRESHRAFLLDMEGTVLHRWEVEIDESDTWQLVEPLSDGDLLVINPGRRLMRIDRDSNVLWQLAERVHHDVAVADSGEILALSRREREVVRVDKALPVLDDVVLRVSPNGEVLEEISILELLGSGVSDEQWQTLAAWSATETAREDMNDTAARTGFRLRKGSPADLLHTNSVEILAEGIDGVASPGSLLVSVRNISTIGIIDGEGQRVEWSWGPGVIRRQHHPSLLDNGHLLVYDNLGGLEGKTRALEVDPHSGEIIWEYNGNPPASFFSPLRGGAERLPNGNTLLTESDRGRVFEVTRDGDIVWEFFNPVMRSEGRERSSIYRLTRLAAEDLNWLEEIR